MSDYIYGHHPVIEALRAGSPLDEILIIKNSKNRQIQEIQRLASQSNVPVKFVSFEQLPQQIPRQKAQGVAALLQSQSYVSIEQIFKASEQRNEPPLLALLDGIEDPHNFGAILRTADGAGVHGVIIPKRRAVGLTATVAKTSAGAFAHMPVAQVSNLNYTIDDLKKRDIWVVGADQEAEQNYNEADLTGPLAIVVGAEGKGMHRLVREKCDFVVRIPMYGKINSLNASVAAALLFFEVRRQRQS